LNYFCSYYKWDCFLDYSSDSSLWKYRSTANFVCWFCILQPYQIHLLILTVFFCGIFRVFCMNNHVICKQGQIDVLLSDSNAFMSFSCLIALARTFSSMLDRVDTMNTLTLWHIGS
jgi:hypothetical protein